VNRYLAYAILFTVLYAIGQGSWRSLINARGKISTWAENPGTVAA